MPRTPHQQRVLEFMQKARQETPAVPTIPDERTCRLRARLILEEALETISALGFTVQPKDSPADPTGGGGLHVEDLAFVATHEPNLVEIADGCADISVVITGTLIACGIHDEPILEAVDANNLAKFGPGHRWREDGKLIKPPNHQKVDLQPILDAQAKQ